MNKLYLLLCIIFIIIEKRIAIDDLYKLLGLNRLASKNDIKKAYRNKARNTHPDKNPNKDPEAASIEFREIVTAYETLSDENQRSYYDKTGQIKSEQKSNNQNEQHNFHNSFHQNFHFHFQRQQQQFHQRQQQTDIHPLLLNMQTRLKILDAQSRTLQIISLRHLKSVIYIDEKDQDEKLERYTLLAFYDSSIEECKNKLFMKILYPYPFAGFSREGVDGIWWEDIMIAGKVDINNGQEEKDLANYFMLKYKKYISKTNCYYITLIPRNGKLTDYSEPESFNTFEVFREWVFQKLKMKITFENKTPWPIDYWYISGNTGIKGNQIAKDTGIKIDTYASHQFFFRADFVTGNALTNESALLWYNSNIKDDGTVINIYSRCFDHSGDCARWKKEGFCDNSRDTRFTIKNPSHKDYVQRECFVSCEIGCGKPKEFHSEL